MAPCLMTRKHFAVVMMIVVVAVAVLAILVYDNAIQPDYSSRLIDNDYTCHGAELCTLKYHHGGPGQQHQHQHQQQQPWRIAVSTGSPSRDGDPDPADTATATATAIHTKQAFFSSLYSDDYLDGALMLGYTLKKYNPRYKIYMMYIPDKVTNRTLCILRKAGWEPYAVNRIAPPEGVRYMYVDQFTKLQLWAMSEFDGIVYLDADTIVCGKLAGLFLLIAPGTGFEFAAAPDNWFGKLTFNFNAGMMVLRPNQMIYHQMLKVFKEPGNYDTSYAEQSFLNEYYRFRYISLPQTYNMNVAIYSRYPHLWDMLRNEFKVVHYTLVKPFRGDRRGYYTGPYDLYMDATREFNDDVKEIKQSCGIAAG